MTLSDLVLAANYGVLCYFVILNSIYVLLYILSFVEITNHMRRESFGGLSELSASHYTPPVSVIVPAYNEEATIAASVRSFLALDYPTNEIVVVNDGSKDATLDVLREEFDLLESDYPVRQQLKTAEIVQVYASSTERLIVVDKKNGGKADALNVGVCAANYPLVCCIDADLILEYDALLKVARPMIESRDVVAVGGIVRVANGCKVEGGRITEVRTPDKILPVFQVVEYVRAFLCSRPGWSALNGLLIISGAFGMFRRQDLIDAGGYADDTVGEDMELVTRMHRTLSEQGRRYRIRFVPDPVAWTEVPDSLKVLGRQRNRWHRGLIDTLMRHRRMLFNPRYGASGMLAMPYFFIFELLGPVIELAGYAFLILGLVLGIVGLEFAALFLAVAVGLGALLSTSAIFLEELRLKRYPRWRDVLMLSVFGILENFGYRQVNTFWRSVAIVSYLRKNSEWGAMERKGFAGSTAKKRP